MTNENKKVLCKFVTSNFQYTIFMKKYLLLSIMISFCVLTHAQNYTLSDIINGKFSARSAYIMESAADGMHYYQTNKTKSVIQKFDYEEGKLKETLLDLSKIQNSPITNFSSFIVSPDGKKILLSMNVEYIYRRSYKADFYLYDSSKKSITPLTKQNAKQMIPIFSPDSKMIAFVVNNNIYIRNIEKETESQVTKDGLYNNIINGTTDWVYEEEFSTTRLMEFSPDSKFLAFVRSDESKVPLFKFQTFEEKLYPGVYEYKYPKPGENNSFVTCYLYDIGKQMTEKLPIPLDKDGYIPLIKFNQNPHELAVMTINRDQNHFKMYFADALTKNVKLILEEQNKYYVDSELFPTISFLKDKFTYVSERDGYSHIYLFDYSGKLKKQLTKGNFDVTDLLAIDESSNKVFYTAADESALKRNIFSVDMNSLKVQKLSKKSGYNTATFSENGKYFTNRWTNSSTPAVTEFYDANGKLIRVLENNEKTQKVISEVNLPKREFIQVPAADGKTMLNAWILKPNNFDSSQKYPLVMVQYSGPNSQQVTDTYGVDWYYALLNEGYMVACVDGRGTGARGEAFRKATYMNIGILESDDQISAAKYFGSLPNIDKDRIGIWGWSFGGYNVLMTMSRGNGTFKAGVAIAAVSDWRFYDSVYTERFMRTPQQNKAGYDNGSPLKLADKLQGKLLLIHGTADDNVHFQEVMEYSRALMKANKKHEMFIFPDKNHSIYGGNTRLFLYEKVIDFYKNNL